MKLRAFALALALTAPAAAQDVPADLTTLPPVPAYDAPRTEWGDPDMRAKYNLDMIQQGRVAFSRPAQYGDRFWKAGRMLMENLQTGKTTELLWRNYRFATGLSAERDFSTNSLARAR